jgi:predicted permease
MPVDILSRAMRRLRAVLTPRARNDDMQAEMREHLDRATERLIARGMPAADARLAARREFGNMTVIQEEARDARGVRWVDSLRGDLRFAFRYFARHKATVSIIVVVLALATGANAMFFSIFQAEFLRPAPAVPADDTQARVYALERATTTAQWEPRAFTHAELQALAGRRELFADVAAWKDEDIILDAGDSTGARGALAQFVTPNYFNTLGVPLAAGQGFSRIVSDAPDLVAVMAWSVAERMYGNAANAVEQRILVNEVPIRVVGVAPRRFQGAQRNMDEPSLWMPLSARADIGRISPRWLSDEPTLSVFARLASGASRAQAGALAQQIVTQTLPDSADRVGMARSAQVLAMHAPSPDKKQEMLLAFTMFLTIGALILLIGWTNVSSLMVAAAVGRRQEIAVRLSLGASRVRLLRQLVTESTLLALTGAVVGLTVASWVLTYMTRVEIDGVDIIPDALTLIFVLGLALASGILFGLSPALHATRAGMATAMRDSGKGSTGRSRLQRGFVVAQITLSLPLLVMLGTILSLVVGEYRPLNPAMSEHVVAVNFRPLQNGGPGQRREAVDSLVPRIASRAEVMGAASDASAFDVRGIMASHRDGKAAPDSSPTIVHLEGVAPGWFTLVGAPVILGRDVSLADTAAPDHPVVIGSDVARRLWGDANPVGRTLASPRLLPGQDSISMTVVGVFDATRTLPGMQWEGGLGAARTNTPARVFTAHGKRWRGDRVLVRTRGPAAPFLPELQRFIRAEAPALPVSGMRTLAQADEQLYRQTVKEAGYAGAGGALALLLASLGLYGVVSLAVQQRTREIGVRIAVGALPTQVTRMFLASGVRLGALALVIGLPLSVAGLHIGMNQGLVIAPGVNPYVVGAGIGVLLLAVAAAATWAPARRAALVDPAITLRQE